MPKSFFVAGLLMFMLVCSFSAQAGQSSYKCLITDELNLRRDGSLKQPSMPVALGKRFDLDRKTGKLVGLESLFWSFTEGEVVVLSFGNADNSFVSWQVKPLHNEGVHTGLVQIEEFTPGAIKPFLASAGGNVFSGVCQ